MTTLSDDAPRVLVVEDEESLAELYRDWLSDDYAVTTAGTAAAGIEAVDEDVDVVLLDRRLPDGAGSDVLDYVREQDLPCLVAMVTAVDPDFDIADMGFDDYLVKPVTREDLRETIEDMLARRDYTDRLRTYVSLVSRRSLLRGETTAPERADSEEFAELERRIERLEADLGDIVADFDDEDFDAAFRSFDHEGDR